MKFRTEVIPDPLESPVEHHHGIITLGSCFADNISTYLNRYRFKILPNPFGVLYNPVSILNSLKLVKDKRIFTRDDLVFHQGEWHSFYHHSDFSSHDPEKVLDKINSVLEKVSEFLSSANRVIITYGTAYAYRLKATGETVSNCHRIPTRQFDRYRLTPGEAEESIAGLIDLLASINRDLKVIFTISPVRHWKDGAVENQLSKSILIAALHNVIDKHVNAEYFPAFEIMMDDLRDYRFYSGDLVHPNRIAADYIWEKFSPACLSRDCRDVVTDIDRLVSAMDHRPRNRESPEHLKFMEENLLYAGELSEKYPHVDFSAEIKYFLSDGIPPG